MGDSEIKRLILARRARFVAAALASVAQAGACNPAPCLEPVPSPPADAGNDATQNDSGTVTPVGDSGEP